MQQPKPPQSYQEAATLTICLLHYFLRDRFIQARWHMHMHRNSWLGPISTTKSCIALQVRTSSVERLLQKEVSPMQWPIAQWHLKKLWRRPRHMCLHHVLYFIYICIYRHSPASANPTLAETSINRPHVNHSLQQSNSNSTAPPKHLILHTRIKTYKFPPQPPMCSPSIHRDDTISNISVLSVWTKPTDHYIITATSMFPYALLCSPKHLKLQIDHEPHKI